VKCYAFLIKFDKSLPMKTTFTFVFILLSFFGLAQQENSQWRFSTNCGLSFTTNPPTQVGSSISGGGGTSSSIADAAGNLLFYTNGTDVRNRLNQNMAGANLPLHGSRQHSGCSDCETAGQQQFVLYFYRRLYRIALLHR
jgi:hypothetical protein